MVKEIELWATMITPFTTEGKVDYNNIDKIVQWYLENGLDGIFAVCQSSEMFFLSQVERLEIAKRVLNAAEGRIRVVVSGHIEESLNEQAEFLQKMAALCPDAVVLVSNRLRKAQDPSDVLYKNTQFLLNQLPKEISLGIYECPYPEKVLLTEEELEFLANTGRFSFMKDTCCDIDMLKKRITVCSKKKMRLFNANTATYLDSLKLGGDGFCGVMLNMHPRLYRYLSDHYVTQPEKARRLQNFLTTASLIERQQYPANAKYHMQLNGLSLELYSRTNAEDLSSLFKREVDHLYGLTEEVNKQLGID